VVVALLASEASAQVVAPDSVAVVPPAPEGWQSIEPTPVGQVEAGVHVDAEAGGPWFSAPRGQMLRSVLIPGWGQWSNGHKVKAAGVALGESYFIYRAIDEGREEDELRARARKEPDRADEWNRAADRSAAHRRDFTWWSVFAVLLSMGDAYVDAVLGPIDDEFEPQGVELREGGGRRSSEARKARLSIEVTEGVARVGWRIPVR